MTTKRNNKRHNGIGLIYAVIIMTALGAICSLALDYGRVQLVKTQLRGAADAAALAAAQYVVSDPAQARSLAVSTAKLNTADGAPVQINSAVDVEFVNWDRASRTYKAAGNGIVPNAVRVTAKRVAARGNAIDLPFARMVGASNTCDVSASSIAMATVDPYTIVGLDYVKMTGNTKLDSVATNGSISMTGSSTIRGDAYAGTGKINGGNVTGNRNSLSSPLVYPAAQGGNIATNNDNLRAIPASAVSSGSIRLSGQKSVTLPAGRYYFKDIILTGGSTLVCQGPVEIYLTGTLSLTGNTTTADNLPDNLKIFVLGSGKVTLTGNTGVYANVYAPTSPITLTGTGDISGSLVGKSISVTGSAIVHQGTSSKRGVMLVK